MKVIVIVLSFLLILSVFSLTGNIQSFFDLYSFLLTSSMALIAVIGRHGLGAFKDLYTAELRNEVLNTILWSSLLAGIIGVLVGTVSILGNMDDPTMIGPALGVAFLSLFYGFFQAYLAFISMDK